MGSEERELNDKDILSKTVVETGENGQMQRYVTALPSGRKLESNWLTEQDRKRALISWTNAVRAEAVADIATAKGQARQDLRQIRSQAQSSIVVPGAPISRAPIPTVAAGPTTGNAPASDPLGYMRQQLQAAKDAVVYWHAQSAIANIELDKAQAQMNQWAVALKSITGVDDVQGSAIYVPAQSSIPVPSSPGSDSIDIGFVPAADGARFEPVESTGVTTEVFWAAE